MINAAQLCVADVELVLQSIASLKGKVLNVYSEEELTTSTSAMSYPACGVVYEGMRSVSEEGSTSKTGNSCELVVSVLLVDMYGAVAKTAVKKNAAPILDAIRDSMMGRKSPTGHKWRFVVEAAASPKQGIVLWVQRWSCPVQLISSSQR
jgi:hypothetical protein